MSQESRSTVWRKKKKLASMHTCSPCLEDPVGSHAPTDWHEASVSHPQWFHYTDTGDDMGGVERKDISDSGSSSSPNALDKDDVANSKEEPVDYSGISALESDEEWFDTESSSVFEMEGTSSACDREWYEEDFEESEPQSTPGDMPLYEGAPITMVASLLLILNFSFCHNLTGECLSDLLVLISVHCIHPNHCLTTLYHFRKYFEHLRSPVVLHKFCGLCSYPSTDKIQSNCVKCNSDLQKNASYFIEVPLAKQLQDMFQRPGFYEDVQHRFHRRKKNINNIEDIYDSRLYKDFSGQGGFLNNPHNISLMWYTDGIPLFKSSNFGIWPIAFTINELSYVKRTRTENLLLGGLWFGSSKPNMNMFWEPFVQSIRQLQMDGISVSPPSVAPDSFTIRAMLLCGTCDLPAKCLVLNMNQFNGEYGCPKCLQPGCSVQSGKGRAWIFPFKPDLVDGPKRTHADTVEHGKRANEEGIKVLGIKGPSWLSVVQPNIVRGTAIDYMHCVLLGIVRRLLKLWFDSAYSREMFSMRNVLKTVDERLVKIKPPNFISRIPRSISDNMKYLKASECRSWLFYYSLPVLSGLMNVEYFAHYMLLVESVYILNMDSISEEQLGQCRKMLMQFVCMFSALYGEARMSANLHQLLHLTDMVRDLGPLWVYSCFPLEDFNGRLLKLFHGTQHPELQIINAVGTLVKLPELNFKHIQDPNLGSFILHMSKASKLPMELHCVSAKKVSLSGLLKDRELSKTEEHAVLLSLGRVPIIYLLYSRLCMGGMSVVSVRCAGVSRRNSSVVRYTCQGALNIGQIEMYLRAFSCDCGSPNVHISAAQICPHEDFAIVRKLTPTGTEFPVHVYGCDVSHLQRIHQTPSLDVISVCAIEELLVLVEVDPGNTFVASRPNNYEGD